MGKRQNEVFCDKEREQTRRDKTERDETRARNSLRRHDKLSYNYRLSEISAAVGLAQFERLNFFLKRRNQMGTLFNKELLKLKTNLLIPQHVPKGFYHSYFSFAAKFEGKKYGIKYLDKNMKKLFFEYLINLKFLLSNWIFFWKLNFSLINFESTNSIEDDIKINKYDK